MSSYDLHGEALLDCFRGDTDAVLICHQDGGRDDVPASFWLRDTVDALEMAALDQCRGKILDIGAGAGVHALELQRRGFDVTAIDIAPQCITVMKERGVNRPLLADVMQFHGDRFDTLLCLCNGLDKVGRLSALPAFLERIRCLMAPGGQLLTDSFDLRGQLEVASNGASATSEVRTITGELALQFEYRGRHGNHFTTLQVDYETLAQVAGQHGWASECLRRKGIHYLARAWLRTEEGPTSPALGAIEVEMQGRGVSMG